jgi:hypothetical protein
MAEGSEVKTATALEFVAAADELWKELGHEGIDFIHWQQGRLARLDEMKRSMQ